MTIGLSAGSVSAGLPVGMFASDSASASPHVSLPAEEVFSINGFPVTNSMITGALVLIVLLGMMFFVAGRVKTGNPRRNRFVSLVQWIFEGLYGTVEAAMPNKAYARKLAPLTITMFFFILINYWVGILPVVGPIKAGVEQVPVFRSLLADLNTTFALAIITIVMGQVYAVGYHGLLGNLGRYFRNPLKDPAGAFEGILELIAEFSRLVGLSLRLFGNVFAGEVLLMMIAFLTVYVSPLALPPFYLFELFIGAIQAYIFFMLTTVFISLGLVSHGHPEPAIDHDQTKPAPAVVAAGHGR